MATSDFNLTRNGLIKMALQKIGALRAGREPSPTQLDQAVQALNTIIRQEDAKNTRQSRDLWALAEKTIQLQAAGYIYTTSSSDGFASDVQDIASAYYRNTDGDDTPIDIITAQQYEAIVNKNDTGDVEKIYIKRNKTLSSQEIYVWPVPSSVGDTSEVTGTDGLNYRCIMGHTSAAINKPITGSSYKLYWEQGGSSGSAWATGTDYTNGELIRYLYKRPLFDFDNATDNPDMPQGWTRYLMWRLAHDLAPEYHLGLDERQWLKGEYLDARTEIFPHTTPNADDFHNKGQFF